MSSDCSVDRERHGAASRRAGQPEEPVISAQSKRCSPAVAGVRDASCQTDSGGKVTRKHTRVLRTRLQMADRQLDALETALVEINLAPLEQKEE